MQRGITYESGKSNVLLTELVIVILFFALTAVTAMQLFVAAHHKSADNIELQNASIAAQNWAERLYGESDPAQILQAEGFEQTQEGMFTKTDSVHRFVMEIGREELKAGDMVYTMIRVYASGGSSDQAITTLCSATYLPSEGGNA